MRGDEPAGFVLDDVGAVVAQDGVGRLDKEAPQCELIAHCSRDNEEAGLGSRQSRDVRFQLRRGGVLAEDVVEQRTGADGSQHGRRRRRHNIACIAPLAPSWPTHTAMPVSLLKSRDPEPWTPTQALRTPCRGVSVSVAPDMAEQRWDNARCLWDRGDMSRRGNSRGMAEHY